MCDYVLGVDGGGTGSRAAVAAADGPVLGVGHAGPANILTDTAQAIDQIVKAAHEALAEAALPPERIGTLRAVLGLAGNNGGNAMDEVTARLPFARSVIVSDGLIALEGAFGGSDGAIASLGTGSVFLLKHNGRVRQFGGWGFFLGDQGSGALIGQDALRRTLLAHDGVIAESRLTADILRAFGNDPGEMLAFAGSAAPGDFARHAPGVFEAAASGDAVAIAIVTEAAAELDAMLDRMLEISGPGPLCLMGGLAGQYPRYLSERHRIRLVAPRADALGGAVSLARRTFLALEAAS